MRAFYIERNRYICEMKAKTFFILLACVFIASGLSARKKPFSEWDSTAFCSYTIYHPYHYINTDNNWEILQALQTARTKQGLDSLGIKTTASQMMLLEIEGLIEKQDDNFWASLIPLFDSLQTVAVREYSRKIAGELYPEIEADCLNFTGFLNSKNLGSNAFSIMFSYVLDGRVWDYLNPFEELESSATWSGECWALYFPREFSCGTNTYSLDDDSREFVLCFTENQPDFIGEELDGDFIGEFLNDYGAYGKIVSPEVRDKALSLGLIHRDGSLNMTVIDKSLRNRLDAFSDKIIKHIAAYFNDSDAVPVFQERFNIANDKRKLAGTILYHEAMWDLMDLLLGKNIIDYPAVWKDGKRTSTRYAVYILNGK